MIKNIVFSIKRKLMPVIPIETANEYLKQALVSGKPLMVARFGATEIKGVLYKFFPYPLSLLCKKHSYTYMSVYSGFFPLDEEMFEKFKDLMLACMRYLDFLASWRPEEILFTKQLAKCKKIPLVVLDPCKSFSTWTQALKGKKVLVIHPFAKTIKAQYEKHRADLFGEYSNYVLPEFASLQVIQAVQTIAGNRAGFETWFDALEYMEREIDKCDFDVALIGCGAYGFPLAAYCKKIGKQGIHVGGPLQLYFGIKGKRWENYGFYNEYWVNPDESEKPKNLEKVEGGCYW